MCVSKFKDTTGRTRYVMAIGCDQGLAASALFFPVWVRYGYSHFFGTSWEDGRWWCDFVDDSILFVMSLLDGELKLRLMDLSKHYMGLSRSPKQDVSFHTEAVFTGLVWSPRGICIGQEAVDYILTVLDSRPGGIKQARTLRGVIVQARFAFKFSAAEMIEFSRQLAIITKSIDEHESSGKFHWNRL